MSSPIGSRVVTAKRLQSQQGLPFYINTVKAGFAEISPRLEHVSRSLGASAGATFFRVTLPLAWWHMVVGGIMCMARAVSEFGAVVIVAYYPMVAR